MLSEASFLPFLSKMRCNYCLQNCIKAGKQKNGIQKWFCKKCKKYQQDQYHYNAYKLGINHKIIILLKEGLGIRSISRVLGISTNTINRRIVELSEKVRSPTLKYHKNYEVDEMRTYVQKKSRTIWIVYAIEKESREVMTFNVGGRTKKTLAVVIQTLLLAKAKKIFTDKLNIYSSLIETNSHSTKFRGTNHIERKHLTLRTHLKRLNRRTICFSKNRQVLRACLKIYFWA